MAIKGVKVDGTTYHFDYEYLENKPIELPDVSAADEGKILQVNSIGAWEAATVSVGSSELCDTFRFYSADISNISSLSAMESDISAVTISPARTGDDISINNLRQYLYGSSIQNNYNIIDLQMPTIEGFEITNIYTKLMRLIIPNASYVYLSAVAYESKPRELKYVDIGSCLTIPDELFAECIKLSYVDAHSCSIIGNSAFAQCSSLTSISLPQAQSIGSNAFNNCSSLTSISLPQAQTISDYAFAYCSSLTDIELPNASLLENSAFFNCTSLTNVNIPSCSYIGEYAFASCRSLSSISMPLVQGIGDYAFNGCISLVSLYMPSLSYIAEHAGFSTCSQLTVVSAPICEYMSSSAFSGATNLQYVYANACSGVGEYTFYGCSSLTEVHLNAECYIPSLAFEDCLVPEDHTLTIYMHGDYSIGYIDENAFGNLGSSGGDGGDGGEECNDGGEECNDGGGGEEFSGPIPGLSIFVPESLYDAALENYPYIYYNNIFSMSSAGE